MWRREALSGHERAGVAAVAYAPQEEPSRAASWSEMAGMSLGLAVATYGAPVVCMAVGLAWVARWLMERRRRVTGR
jgi:hypothetical protein